MALFGFGKKKEEEKKAPPPSAAPKPPAKPAAKPAAKPEGKPAAKPATPTSTPAPISEKKPAPPAPKPVAEKPPSPSSAPSEAKKLAPSVAKPPVSPAAAGAKKTAAPPPPAAQPAKPSSSGRVVKPSPAAVAVPQKIAQPSGVGIPEEKFKQTDTGRRIRTSPPNKQIGQLLLAKKSITEEQLNRALKTQSKEGGLLGQILVAQQSCDKGAIGAALKKQLAITTVLLDRVKFDPEAIKLLPRSFCERNRLIPFEKIGNQLCVAMSNVLDAQAKKDVKDLTKFQIKAFDASWQEIQQAIEKYIPPEAPKEKAKEEKKEAKKIEEVPIVLPKEEEIAQKPAEVAKPTAPGKPAIPPVEKKPGPPSPKPEVPGKPIPGAPTAIPKAAVPEKPQKEEVLPKLTLPSYEVETIPLPAKRLSAIPLREDYVQLVLQEGQADAERRWLAEHLVKTPIPVVPTLE